MAVTVIDCLEAVQIEHAHRQRNAIGARRFEGLIQQVGEVGAVWQASQHIVPHAPLQGVQQLTLFADIKTDRQILAHLPRRLIHQRHHGTVHPVDRAVFTPVADFAFPDLPPGNGAPHADKELGRMKTRVQDAMVGPQQFLTRVTRHVTELLVDVGDAPT